MIRLVLPFPPSLNHYTHYIAVGKTVQAFPSKAAKAFRSNCEAAVVEQIGLARPVDYKAHVTITFHRKDLVAFDLDNFAKVLLDCLKHCRVISDDKIIDRLVLERGYVSRDHPRAEVEIVELAPPAADLFRE